MTFRTAPRPANRPKFWRFYRDCDLTLAQVAEVLGRTPEWVRLICLPFDDPKRRVPDQADMERIREWSGGEILSADWYPPELSDPRVSSPIVAEAR